jgi:hypothetical protein
MPYTEWSLGQPSQRRMAWTEVWMMAVQKKAAKTHWSQEEPLDWTAGWTETQVTMATKRLD